MFFKIPILYLPHVMFAVQTSAEEDDFKTLAVNLLLGAGALPCSQDLYWTTGAVMDNTAKSL